MYNKLKEQLRLKFSNGAFDKEDRKWEYKEAIPKRKGVEETEIAIENGLTFIVAVFYENIGLYLRMTYGYAYDVDFVGDEAVKHLNNLLLCETETDVINYITSFGRWDSESFNVPTADYKPYEKSLRKIKNTAIVL